MLLAALPAYNQSNNADGGGLSPRKFHTVLNLAILFQDSLVVLITVRSDMRQDLERFVGSVRTHEVSWALGQEREQQEEQHGRHGVECKW